MKKFLWSLIFWKLERASHDRLCLDLSKASRREIMSYTEVHSKETGLT